MSGRPSISSSIVSPRSPLATAPMTRAISVVGWTRSPMSVLIDWTQVAQEPGAVGSATRWAILPSRPTAMLTFSKSRAMRSLRSMMSLSASAIFPAMAVLSAGIRTVKSPFLTAVKTFRS